MVKRLRSAGNRAGRILFVLGVGTAVLVAGRHRMARVKPKASAPSRVLRRQAMREGMLDAATDPAYHADMAAVAAEWDGVSGDGLTTA